MRGWPSIEAGDVDCPTLLLAGTKNRTVLEWLEGKLKYWEDMLKLYPADNPAFMQTGIMRLNYTKELIEYRKYELKGGKIGG